MTQARISLVWVGNAYFSSHLADYGIDVTRMNTRTPGVSYDEIVEAASGPPDVVVYGDWSIPPPLTDIVSYPCLTLFFCVDSHIHSWYSFYAQAFDLLVLNLKDNLPQFLGKRLVQDDCLWMPLYAKSRDRPIVQEKTTDVLFVGTVDPETTPIRAVFLEKLGELLHGLEVTRGDYRSLYGRARIVLNIAERGDFNFRVFEAMGCGSCLLTPHTGHGLDELFVDGKDLHCYRQNDPQHAAEVARRLLADDDLRRETETRALATIDAGHRDTHRAARLAAFVKEKLATPERVQRRLRQKQVIHDAYLKLLYLHFAEKIDDPALQALYLRASLNSAV